MPFSVTMISVCEPFPSSVALPVTALVLWAMISFIHCISESEPESVAFTSWYLLLILPWLGTLTTEWKEACRTTTRPSWAEMCLENHWLQMKTTFSQFILRKTCWILNCSLTAEMCQQVTAASRNSYSANRKVSYAECVNQYTATFCIRSTFLYSEYQICGIIIDHSCWTITVVLPDYGGRILGDPYLSAPPWVGALIGDLPPKMSFPAF